MARKYAITAREYASCVSFGYLRKVSDVRASVKVCTKRSALSSYRIIRFAGAMFSRIEAANSFSRSLAALATGVGSASDAFGRSWGCGCLRLIGGAEEPTVQSLR